MRKGKYSDEQVIAILREQEAGRPTAEICRKYGVSNATFYKWKSKFGGMQVSDAKRLKALEEENRRLKKRLAEEVMDSSTGARLEIEDVGALPTTFQVSIDTIGFEAHCKVRHKYGRKSVGVSFVTERGSAKLAALMSSLNPLSRTLAVSNHRQCAFGRRGRGAEKC